MASSEFKNGYNACVEEFIALINQEIACTKTGDTSVNDVLRFLRRKILDISFNEKELNRSFVCSKKDIQS